MTGSVWLGGNQGWMRSRRAASKLPPALAMADMPCEDWFPARIAPSEDMAQTRRLEVPQSAAIQLMVSFGMIKCEAVRSGIC